MKLNSKCKIEGKETKHCITKLLIKFSDELTKNQQKF